MSRIKNHITLLFCIMALWVGCFLYGGVAFFEIIKVLMYNLNLALIGLAVAYAILPAHKTKDNFLLPLSVSFPIGLSVENILFILFSSFHIRFLLTPVFIVSGVVSILVLYKNFRQKGIGGGLDWSLVWGILFLVAAFLFFIATWYYSQFTIPQGNQKIHMYSDLVWHLGNVQEAVRHWPLQDPRMAGLPFKYHYFAYLHMACQCLVVKVNADTVLFRTFVPVFMTWLALLSFCISKYFWQDNFKCLFSVILLFFTGSLEFLLQYRLMFLNTFFYVLFLSPPYLMGLSVFLSFVMVYLILDKQKIRLSEMFLLGLLFWTSLGAKGPGGLILIGSVWFVTGIGALRKSPLIRWHVYLVLAMLIIFVLSFFFIFGGFNSSSDVLKFSPLAAIYTSPFYMGMMNICSKYLQNNDALNIIFQISVVLMFIFGFFSYRIVALKYVFEARRIWKEMNYGKLFLFFIVFLSLCGGFLLEADGKSQLYFIVYGYFFISLLAAGFCFNYIRKSSMVVKIILSGFIIISFPSIGSYFVEGISMTVHRTNLKYGYRGGLTGSEAQLLMKLREISREDDVILGNAFFIDEGRREPRWFYGSALSGRRFFLEGWRFGGIVHAGDFEKRKNLAFNTFSGRQDINLLSKQYGIKYIVFYEQHKTLMDPFEKGNPHILKVYENSGGKIYKIIQNPN